LALQLPAEICAYFIVPISIVGRSESPQPSSLRAQFKLDADERVGSNYQQNAQSI
jgi:hypothetical protein